MVCIARLIVRSRDQWLRIKKVLILAVFTKLRSMAAAVGDDFLYGMYLASHRPGGR